MIREIGIEKIHPHKDNPRKDLGDLAELTDSIRAFGILQNLTVVPNGDEYTVVCGHRRLAAAKEAGLEVLPCVVAEDMDQRTQVSIMLLENMQRSDLTAQEEAQGFQMMMDLGASIAEIVKETGLSETKVRHRVKLNELDQKVLAEKMAKNISIGDLIKLEQIKDPDAKNEVLKAIGTNNFDMKLKEAIDNQAIAHFTSFVNETAPGLTDIEYTWRYKDIDHILCTADDEEIEEFIEAVKKAAEKEGVEPGIRIYGIRATSFITSEEERTYISDPKERETREKQREAVEALGQKMERIESLWEEYVKGLSNSKAKDMVENLLGWLVVDVIGVEYDNIDEMLQFMDVEMPMGGSVESLDKDEELKEDLLMELFEKEKYKMTIVAILITLMPYTNRLWDWRGEFDGSDQMAKIRDFLQDIGYMESDDEAAFLSGDSDLYWKEEE